MSSKVMIVVLFAALLHAAWNFLVKREADKYLSMSAVVIGHAPFAGVALIISPLPGMESLPYLIISAFLHAGYQFFLLNSYRFGDLSQVYPLARGVAPMIVAGISLFLMGIDLSWIEISAIITIGTGIMSLSLMRYHDGRRNGQAAFLALTTGGFIAGYSLVDGMGAREAGTAFGFYGCLSMINALVFAIIMKRMRPGLLTKLISPHWRLSLAGGGASFLAYSMVIWAFTQSPIALVTALRETSILFALLFGAFFLKERIDIMKILATILTLFGVAMLRIS